MSVLQLLNLGAAPNDGTGTPARDGGQIINQNFATLNNEKVESITSNNPQVTVDIADPINPQLQIPQIVEGLTGVGGIVIGGSPEIPEVSIGNFLQSVVDGANIDIDNGDPQNPQISVTPGAFIESVISGDASLTVDDTDPANLDIRVAGGLPTAFTQLEVSAPFPATVPDAWHNRHVILNGSIGVINIDVPDNLNGGAGFHCRVTYVGNADVRFTETGTTVLIFDETALDPPRFRDGRCSLEIEQRTGQVNQVFVRGDLAQ